MPWVLSGHRAGRGRARAVQLARWQSVFCCFCFQGRKLSLVMELTDDERTCGRWAACSGLAFRRGLKMLVFVEIGGRSLWVIFCKFLSDIFKEIRFVVFRHRLAFCATVSP
jgi:hypothetical protein